MSGLWVLGHDLCKQVNMSILAAQVGGGLLCELVAKCDIYVWVLQKLFGSCPIDRPRVLKALSSRKINVLTMSTNFLVFSLTLMELLLTTCCISFVPNLFRAFGDSVLLTTATLSGD